MNREQAEALIHLKRQSDAVGAVVDIMNAYREYLDTPKASPQEDQTEKALEDEIEKWAKDVTTAREVIMAFTDALISVSRGADFQDYLNHVSEFLQQAADEIQERDQ